MAYKKKQIAFEAVLKGRDKSLKGLTDISQAFKNITYPIDRINRKLARTLAAVSPITNRLNSVSRSFRKVGVGMSKAVGAVGAVAGGFSLFQSANFEAELNKVEALVKKKITVKVEEDGVVKDKEITVSISKDETKKLSDIAEKLNRDTQFSGDQVLKGMKFLAMADFRFLDVQKMITPTVHLTGAAQLNSEISLKETADIFTNIMTPFGIGAERATEIADKLAYGFSNSNTTLEEMGGAMESMASLAENTGVTFEQSLALLMSVAGSGIKGEKAGTAFAGAFSRLLNLTPEAVEIMENKGITPEEKETFLNKKTGKIEDFIKFLAVLKKHDMKPGEVIKILGQESGKYLVGLIDKNTEITDILKNIEKKSGGEAKRLNEVNLKGFWGQLTLFTSSVTAFAKKLGDLLLIEWATDLLETATEWMKTLTNMDEEWFKMIGTITLVISALAGLAIAIGIIAAAASFGTAGVAVATGLGASAIAGAGSAALAVGGAATSTLLGVPVWPALAGIGTSIAAAFSAAPITVALGTAVAGSEAIDAVFGTNIGLVKKVWNLEHIKTAREGIGNLFVGEEEKPEALKTIKKEVDAHSPLLTREYLEKHDKKKTPLNIYFHQENGKTILSKTTDPGKFFDINFDRGLSAGGAQ